jgi:hypothetical protein
MAKRTRKTSAKSPPEPAKKLSGECFTIMPFGGWFDGYYSNIYCPAITNAGLLPRRADDLYRPSAIVHDIWAYTKSCRLILADLTGKNPNVFYELGLAHAIAKPAILVAESISDVPFDLRALRVLEYDKNDPVWGDVLRVKIENAIKEVLAAPLQAVLPSFFDVTTISKPAVSEHQKELVQIRQELDGLRREIRRGKPDYEERGELSYSEARDMVRRFLVLGMPSAEIVNRLVRLGAPSSGAARSVIAEIQKQLRIETLPSAPEPNSEEVRIAKSRED